MKSKRPWRLTFGPRVLLLVLVLVALHFQTVAAAELSDAQTKCIRSAPRSFTREQREQLCRPRARPELRQAPRDPTIPGQCATLAIGGRALQTGKLAPRAEQLRTAAILRLCSNAIDTGPAQCWRAFPSSLHHQTHATATYGLSDSSIDIATEVAQSPLVQLCHHARDDRPASCYIAWLKASGSLNKRDALTALETVTEVCRGFTGQANALGQCAKRTVRLLGNGAAAAVSGFQLCRFIGDGQVLSAIVECASELKKKRVSSGTISELCARATVVAGDDAGGYLPQACFIPAMQKLRWMDETSMAVLCGDAVGPFADVPVRCATQMKTAAQRLLSSSPHPTTAALPAFVAELCHGATNDTKVADCVNILPTKALSSDQVLQLCAASTLTSNLDDRDATTASHVGTCVSQARTLLQRAVMSGGGHNSHERNVEMATSAAVQVCEQATSDAPSTCLADVQHDHALTVQLRVALCRQARSDAPQLCLQALRGDIRAQRLDLASAVLLCSQTESLGSADCANELLKNSRSTTTMMTVKLCQGANSTAPARCFLEAPRTYSDNLKTTLCRHAESTAPAICAAFSVSRMARDPGAKAALCHGAKSPAPAICAIEAPFNMHVDELVQLCQSAESDAPAHCAQAVTTSLGLSRLHVAQVCAGATSTTPGRCLAHHVRRIRLQRRIGVESAIIAECRATRDEPSSLQIAHASYNCPELQPMCPMQLVLHVLDQFGDPMVEDQYVHGLVSVKAVLVEYHDRKTQESPPELTGPKVVVVANGSATFSDLVFTGAGEFLLTFRAGPSVSEEVVRVLVHADLAAEAIKTRCDAIFERFRCRAAVQQNVDDTRLELQVLLLPWHLHVSAEACEQHWRDTMGGLTFRGLGHHESRHGGYEAIYTLPRALYELFTHMNVPRADMSARARLGLREDETSRAAIRRAYHRKSLEWHPDKWHALAAVLSPARRQQLDAIFTLVAEAYDELSHPHPHSQ